MTSATRRLAVRFEEAVWQEAIRGFSREPLQIAMSARRIAERHGIALADVHPCEAIGPDGTQLVGCAKLYLPLGDGPPSERPMAFVLRLARAEDGTLAWIFVAFGHRHPGPGVRSVYERAHRQLHGRFPDHRGSV
jgi:hypothetical protein